MFSCISRPWLVAFVFAFLLVSGYQYLFAAPAQFSPGTLVSVSYGTSVPEIASNLADAHIIKHPTLFRALLRLSGEGGNVQMGVYKFAVPQNLFVVMYRLLAGDYGLPPVRLTFIEGVTTREVAVQVAAAFPTISAKDFLAVAKPQEGYLFPDTYLFQPSATTESIITTVRANFDKKITSISEKVGRSGYSLSDIVIIASLVEKEARTDTDRHIVAGILWNRIKLGMPLQVDAVFGYIFNRSTYSPSPVDLKVDSPYNTYTHRGLPPTPICNTGLAALEASANPAKTSYLYYLTGHDGLMHYATTYAGHQANLKKYLY